MMRKLLLVAALFCPSFVWGTTYTFDNLSNGPIAGQDNWMVLAGSGDLSDVIQAGTGFDTSKVMANPGPAGTGVHRMGRTNNGNFTFGNLTGVTGLTLSFDTQVMNNASIPLNFINFGLADQNLAHSSPAFSFTQVNGGTPSWGLGAGTNNASGSFGTNFTTGDWIRMTFVMNFTTNGGQGFGSLFFNDLTTGGSQQTLATNFNLMGTGANSSFWNTMWSRSDNGPDAATSNVVQDNLTIIPSFAAVPEMSGVWAAGLLACFLGAHFLCRRVARS